MGLTDCIPFLMMKNKFLEKQQRERVKLLVKPSLLFPSFLGTGRRKCVSEWVEDKDRLSRFVCTGPFWHVLPISGENVPLFLVKEGHLSHGKFYDLFVGRGGIQRAFLHLLFLKCLQLKILKMPKPHTSGRRVLIPFSTFTRRQA